MPKISKPKLGSNFARTKGKKLPEIKLMQMAIADLALRLNILEVNNSYLNKRVESFRKECE